MQLKPPANQLDWAHVAIGLLALGAVATLVTANRDRDPDQSSNYDSEGTRGGGDRGNLATGNNEPNPDAISKAADLLASKQTGDLMGGLGGLMGGLSYASQLAAGTTSAPSSATGEKKAVAGVFNIVEWCKLMFNPVELVKAICIHFKLDFDKVSASIGTHSINGAEAVLTPLVVTTKIVEKVFVPDVCRLKFICKMGAHLEFIKGHVLKFSSKFLEGSNYLKAFSDGVTGRDCEVAFAGCATGEPKLTKQYQEMRALQQPQSISTADADQKQKQPAKTGAVAPRQQQPQPATTTSDLNPEQSQKIVQKASKSAINRIAATS